ncbi:UPF0496 protein At4g34320-like [Nymphaea colorata]|nr:UPF0496 protein At4g34320-like [Nymphaea colorata]XP_031488836.2 UPF0496 protein At4g34320-like [Nymphaea colorata]
MKSLIGGFRRWRKRTEDGSSVSFHSLSEATVCFLRANQDASREIAMLTEATFKNDQLCGIVMDYLDLSYKTLSFLYDMQGCLKAFGDRSFPQTKVSVDGRLIDDVLLSLDKVMAAHGLMLRKLGQFRLSKSKRIQTLLRRRKLIHCVFLTVFVGAVVCSSIAAAVHAPPLLAALPAAVVTAATFGPLTSWVQNFWKEEECDIKARLQTANVLNVSSSVLIRELQAIGFSVRALTDHKTRLACHRGFISRNKGNGILPDSLMVERSGNLVQKIEELDKQLSECCQGIETARKQMLDRLNSWTEPAEMEDGSARSETCCSCIPFWCCVPGAGGK